ncbi:CAP domain-containing protein [Sneathiella limimaris]|uniref:CAP domain-containing protein n=1 Tax=Sneathiella limimaris TaxID=1964213 RepID=UPI001469AAC3|nr:CAP domain-containing protein [Sneathiella limimaris]
MITTSQQLLSLINGKRHIRNLTRLLLNQSLSKAARLHSDFMASTGTLSHLGKDNSTLMDRLNAVGYHASILAENIALCDGNPMSSTSLWMDSTPHRENLLNPNFTEIGIGITRDGEQTAHYWTIVLAAPLLPKTRSVIT